MKFSSCYGKICCFSKICFLGRTHGRYKSSLEKSIFFLDVLVFSINNILISKQKSKNTVLLKIPLKIMGSVSICWLLLHMIFLLLVNTGCFLRRRGVVLYFLSYQFCPYQACTEIGRENVHRYLGTE